MFKGSFGESSYFLSQPKACQVAIRQCHRTHGGNLSSAKRSLEDNGKNSFWWILFFAFFGLQDFFLIFFDGVSFVFRHFIFEGLLQEPKLTKHGWCCFFWRNNLFFLMLNVNKRSTSQGQLDGTYKPFLA